MISIALFVVFAAFAALMASRRVPALLALPIMALSMALIAGCPWTVLGSIVTDGSVALAPVYVAVIFGAILGAVTIDTGIARALVHLAAEFAGENPIVVTLALAALIAVLFVSLSGLGAIIMVGSIVLPIMMTTGVPRRIAATVFLLSFALGFIFNIANWKFYTKFFGVDQGSLVHYALILAAIDAAVLVIYTIVAFRSERDYATFAIAAEKSSPRVPWYALLAPVLPIALYFIAHIDATPAFAISAIYAALTAAPRRAINVLSAAAIRGVENAAPAIVLFIGIGMLLTATKQPQFAAALQPLVHALPVTNPLGFIIVFGFGSVLTLYRGPLNPFGVGIAVFTALLGANMLPPVVLVAAIMAIVQVQNVCDPTNTANVWVANFTGVSTAEIGKLTLGWQVAVAVLACGVIVALPAVTGAPFLAAMPIARADAWPGMFAPPNAHDRVGVEDDGTPDAHLAANRILALLDAQGALRAQPLAITGQQRDCSSSPVAAVLRVTASRWHDYRGDNVDIGVKLSDCGGWPIGEWHDQAAPANDATVQHLADEGLARLLLWAKAHSVDASHLWTLGFAFGPTDPPTYCYSLFKSVDGNMRAFVRAGGPAWDSGLRTGDIIDTLDGKYWWEYGTFQTQARAFDGLPHTYGIHRDGKKMIIQLGQPFIAATENT